MLARVGIGALQLLTPDSHPAVMLPGVPPAQALSAHQERAERYKRGVAL